MAIITTDSQHYSNIADAIREKLGGSDTYTPSEMANAILEIPSIIEGSAGIPVATKSAVSNHSVTVTPSVTNTTGYITGGTLTGTSVSVTASELVSGSQTITNNSTVDVTNLAEVVVALSFSNVYSGSSAPSSSLGVDGDIYLQV